MGSDLSITAVISIPIFCACMHHYFEIVKSIDPYLIIVNLITIMANRGPSPRFMRVCRYGDLNPDSSAKYLTTIN